MSDKEWGDSVAHNSSTPDSWRYEKLAESAARSLASNDWITKNPEILKQQLLHLMNKAFEMGREHSRRIHRPRVPVQDLTHIPELFNHARDRWEKGTCH